MPSSSSRRFEPRWQPQYPYLVDTSISPYVAAALKALKWDVRTVAECLAGGDVRKPVPDQDIIPICKRHGFTWITADEAAQVDHADAIWRNGIHVLWIHRPGGVMLRNYQLAVVSAAVGAFDCRLDDPPPMGLWCEHREALSDRLEQLTRVPYGNGRQWRIGRAK